MKWEKTTARFSTGSTLRLTGVIAAQTYWAASTDAKGEKLPPWGASALGVRLKDRFHTEEEAQRATEKFLRAHLVRALENLDATEAAQ